MKDLIGKERPTNFPNFQIENVIMDAPILGAHDKLVLFKLIRHAYGFDKNHSYPSKKTIALTTGLSYKTVQRTLNSLEERGYVWSEERKENNCYLPTLYYWDKEKILKDCVLSCLKHDLIKGSEIPKVWMDAILLEKNLKEIQAKGLVTQTRPLRSERPEGLVTQTNKEEQYKKNKQEKQKEEKKTPSKTSSFIPSSPPSSEGEKTRTKNNHKEKLQLKALERVEQEANKIKQELLQEGYREKDLNEFFKADIAKRKQENRIHFLDPTARSYKKLISEGKNEWQTLINKFREKHHKACKICESLTPKEYCETCERKPALSLLSGLPKLSQEEKNLRYAKEQVKYYLSQERDFKKSLANDPNNSFGKGMLELAQGQVQRWREELLKHCSSANECNQIVLKLKAQIEKQTVIET